jgi:phosphopantetheine adenylyltransferase
VKNYIYNSDVGTFEIVHKGHLDYQLWIGEELLGEYESAELAAEDVATFNTDYVEWDRFKNELENFPKNLTEWTAVTEERPRQ